MFYCEHYIVQFNTLLCVAELLFCLSSYFHIPLMPILSRSQTFLFVTASISLVILAFTGPDSLAFSKQPPGEILPHSALRVQSSTSLAAIGYRGHLLNHRVDYYPLIAQQGTNTNPTSSIPYSKDISNALTVLVIVLILPLLWGPSRKAVGLLNIIVGTILTITGIGAIFGLPMILIGGICLFI